VRMKRDDNTEEGEKSGNSRSQLYLIVASVLVIIVMGFVLVRLLKKGPEPELKPESAGTSATAQQVLAPPPVPEKAITSLDNAAPAAPAAPAAVAKPKKTEAHPAPAAPPVPAISQAPPPAPAPRAVAPKSSPQKDVKKAPAPAGAGLDGTHVPRASAPASAKPKVKTAKEVRRVKAKPSHKKVVDVQAEKPRHAAEHLRARASEPAKPAAIPAPAKPAPSENSAETLSKKPDEGSFVSEAVRPPPEPFAPVTPSETAAPSAVSEAKPEKQKPEARTGSEEAKAPAPEFTLLVKTFKGEAEAKDYVQELKKKGYKSFLVKKETTKFTWYNVMAGEFADREAADKAAEDFLGKEDVRAVVQPYPEQ